ncbi:hypothetical protein [Pseudoalteromonas sp. T1lg23B]|nr:hypothetical protein [Pseudoalteromonas sp. T1lg23B]
MTHDYRFYVGFSFPLLGELFSYSGLLSLETDTAHTEQTHSTY